jgi:hypothetical protein
LRIFNFFVGHLFNVVKIVFFLFHYLLTSGPPNKLVLVNSCAPLAVPLAFFGMYALGTRGARLPDFPGVPV